MGSGDIEPGRCSNATWKPPTLSTRGDDDRQFDFHALRGQFITELGRQGVSLQEAQKLARHSDPRLTANHYTHLSVHDLSRSVGKLPTLPEPQPSQATGTDDATIRRNNRPQTTRKILTTGRAKLCNSVEESGGPPENAKPPPPIEKPRKSQGKHRVFTNCERGDSNPHELCPQDPKSSASANSATLAVNV